MSKAVESFMADLIARNPAEPQFHQAVREVVESVMPIIESTPALRQAKKCCSVSFTEGQTGASGVVEMRKPVGAS